MERVAILSPVRQLSFSFVRQQRGPVKYSEADYARWTELYQEGKSFREIEALCGVPYATVAWRVRKKLGITDGRKCGRKKKYAGLSNAGVQRQWQLKEHYGLTLEQYEAKLSEQGGVCAICGKPPLGGSTSTASLHVDHDHVTGEIRALLCHKCNPAIGQFSDDPALLERAAAYLRRYQEAV